MDGYQRLASAIIELAADDLRTVIKKSEKCKNKIKQLQSKGDYVSLKKSDIERDQFNKLTGQKRALVNFFKSEWCADLCDMVEVNAEVIKEGIRKNIMQGVCD